ncbi:MAG: alanine dehydrogenase [bacterium]
MVIGTPRESNQDEYRVGLTPFGVARLVHEGQSVLVEQGAGLAARFSDQDFEKAGAQIVYRSEELYRRADIVCRVGALSADEIAMLKPKAIICGFHHLAVAPRDHVARLMELKATLIGYEIIRDAAGDLPVLTPISEMAGQMAMHVAANLLQNHSGGRGVLLGSVAGVPPPTVLILGAGAVGVAAARQAAAAGAHVIVLDADVRKLRALHRNFSGEVVTVVAAMDRLERYTALADVVIGAVLIPGARSPFVVTESMVRAMKPGSVIIDVSIDQGGCIETSRPTTIGDPTFVYHDVVHYCVPNMTANLARTASRALATATLPYLVELSGHGLTRVLREDPGFAAGVYLYDGVMVNAAAGGVLGFPAAAISQLIS